MGTKIEFSEFPEQNALPQTKFNKGEKSIVKEEIQKLALKGVVEPASHENDEIISNVFLRKKPDGSHRLILNLKDFNSFVKYQKFKMDTLNTILNLMSDNCFMASVDLKDAYYSIPVAKEHRKYLRFIFEGQLYQFTCLPNGLSSCPRKFTKVLKPPLSTLHKLGNISMAYLDDIYLQGKTYEECLKNVIETMSLFAELGFVIHPIKSNLIPSQELTILGFILNSVDMSVRLSSNKKSSLKKDCTSLLKEKKFTIREVARVIGKIVSSFPGVMHGPLYYRNLEEDKN